MSFSDNRERFVKLETGFDEQGNKVKIEPRELGLGKPIFVTDGINEKEIKIQGEVVDTKDVGFL